LDATYNKECFSFLIVLLLKSDKKGMGLSRKLMIAGVLICICGAALGWGILPAFIKNKVNQVNVFLALCKLE